MPHSNAKLSAARRLRMARLIVDDGMTAQDAANLFAISRTTASKWARRYLIEGPAGMVDRSSARGDYRVRQSASQADPT